jgi:putative IMPACT (imprinted ancient) family translation regulator
VVDYSQLEIMQRIGAAQNATTINTEYTDKVKFTFRMKEADVEGFLTAVREATSGRCTPTVSGPMHAAM